MQLVKKQSQLCSVLVVMAVVLGIVMGLGSGPASMVQAIEADNGDDRLAIIEIRVKVDSPFEGNRLPRWDTVEIADQTYWATSGVAELATARILTLVRTNVGDRSYRNQVHFTGDMENPLVIQGRLDLPALEFRLKDGILWIAEVTEDGERANRRMLQPGDRLETTSWPGVSLIYHAYIPRSDILGFEVKAGIEAE